MASIPLASSDINGVENGHSVQEYDVIIVGAGFSGISALHRLRKDGLKTHIFEGASDFGGVWYWNRYPGARVDSEAPFYQLSIPELYNTFNFTQRFPDHREIRRYMAHADKILNLRKDVSFNSKVNSCTWDKEKNQWSITTEDGKRAKARWLLLCTGLLHRTFLPQWEGMDKFKGVIHHSGAWPENTSVKGKKVAVIGAGATAVQIVQELGKEADHLTNFVRRPSYCIPMRQRTWTPEEQIHFRAYYPALFAASRNSFVGFPSTPLNKRVQDDSPEENEAYLNDIWQGGGFQFLLRNYNNVSVDPEANKVIYDFWKRKVRERLTDKKKQDIMAPDEAPYYFATKRSPLEHDYYEVLNQDNVEVVNLNAHPIESFTEKGLKLGGEEVDREFDVIVCATGFDSFTGSLTNLGLKNKDGVDIKDIWKDGVKTYLGMTMHGFPNAFMVYTPQAPTALSNGPTIIEAQVTFACDTIEALQKEGAKTIEPTRKAEEEWKAGMNAVYEMTLYKYTSSWWNTANIPGKAAENHTYIGGVNKYEAQCREKMVGWQGFNVVANA